MKDRYSQAIKFRDERRAEVAAARILLHEKVIAGELTPQQIGAVAAIYPDWAPGINYAVGDIVQYDAKLFIVLQAHTSQADWTPPAVPALFRPCLGRQCRKGLYLSGNSPPAPMTHTT